MLWTDAPVEWGRRLEDVLLTRLAIANFGLLFLIGCQQQPQRQPKMSDAQLQRLHRELPGMTDECLGKMKWEGTQALPNELDKCFKMLPAAHWRGLWRRDFEVSIFCPAPAAQCSERKAANPIELEFNPGIKVPGIDAKTPPGGLYAVDFIGRRTAHGGIYGDGPLTQQLFVDRLISIQEIEAAPKD